MATSLPQYSWGYDPSTGSWGYLLKQAGDQSADVGRKTGDKLSSYSAPQGDAASVQQQALQYLMDQQTAPAAPTSAPSAAAATPVAGSGLAVAGGGHGISGTNGAGNIDPAGTSNPSPDNAYGATVAAALGNYASGRSPMSISGNVARLISDNFAKNNDGYSFGSDPTGYADARDAAARGLGVGNTDPNGIAGANGMTGTEGNVGKTADDSSHAPAAGEGSSNGMTGTEGNAGKSSDDSHSSEASTSSTAATGGIATPGAIRHFADGGTPDAGLGAALQPRMVHGPGDGQSDSIPVTMDDGGQGRLADSEFVFPADVVSALGSGSSEAGARALYAMVDRIRQTAHGHTKQANPVDPSQVMPV